MFSNQLVLFDKAIFYTKNDLLAILRTGGLDFQFLLRNMFVSLSGCYILEEFDVPYSNLNYISLTFSEYWNTCAMEWLLYRMRG